MVDRSVMIIRGIENNRRGAIVKNSPLYGQESNT